MQGPGQAGREGRLQRIDGCIFVDLVRIQTPHIDQPSARVRFEKHAEVVRVIWIDPIP
jgi:hypothetical protein